MNRLIHRSWGEGFQATDLGTRWTAPALMAATTEEPDLSWRSSTAPRVIIARNCQHIAQSESLRPVVSDAVFENPAELRSISGQADTDDKRKYTDAPPYYLHRN